MPETIGRVFLRIEFAPGLRLGPGKIALLEAIAEEKSISGAARKLGMSYRRAWLLVSNLNQLMKDPAVVTVPGRHDKAATLTPSGEAMVASWHRFIAKVESASLAERMAIEALLDVPPKI